MKSSGAERARATSPIASAPLPPLLHAHGIGVAFIPPLRSIYLTLPSAVPFALSNEVLSLDPSTAYTNALTSAVVPIVLYATCRQYFDRDG